MGALMCKLYRYNSRVPSAHAVFLSAQAEPVSAQAEFLSAQVELPSAQAEPLSEQIAPPKRTSSATYL